MREFATYCLVTIALIMLLMIMSLTSEVNVSQDKIDVCEKELPRNEHCVLVAIPKGSN